MGPTRPMAGYLKSSWQAVQLAFTAVYAFARSAGDVFFLLAANSASVALIIWALYSSHFFLSAAFSAFTIVLFNSPMASTRWAIRDVFAGVAVAFLALAMMSAWAF